MSGLLTAAEASVGQHELADRYSQYRHRQAARLVRMLPKDAIRPLYRRARREAQSVAVSPAADPLAVLVGYCERLMPLPPFEVWMEDVSRHPEAHFRDVEESAHGPTAEAPLTVDAREFEVGAETWTARLCGFRSGGLWRAYISFEPHGAERIYRTATVFCEEDTAGLRRRFVEYNPEALRAFLRSALP